MPAIGLTAAPCVCRSQAAWARPARRAVLRAHAPRQVVARAHAEAQETAGTGAEQASSSGSSVNQYRLNFLWMERNVAVSVDQVLPSGVVTPLTEYFFWPRKDAWEELKAALERKGWIPERDRVVLLNRATEVINYWQDDESSHTVEDARKRFPDCTFAGA